MTSKEGFLKKTPFFCFLDEKWKEMCSHFLLLCFAYFHLHLRAIVLYGSVFSWQFYAYSEVSELTFAGSNMFKCNLVMLKEAKTV